jgi:hypothetical protein
MNRGSMLINQLVIRFDSECWVGALSYSKPRKAMYYPLSQTSAMIKNAHELK